MIEVFHWSLGFKDINKKKKKILLVGVLWRRRRGRTRRRLWVPAGLSLFLLLFRCFCIVTVEIDGCIFDKSHYKRLWAANSKQNKALLRFKIAISYKMIVSGVFITKRNFVRLKLRGQTAPFFFLVCVCEREFREGNYFILFSVKLADLYCCLGWFVLIWANF